MFRPETANPLPKGSKTNALKKAYRSRRKRKNRRAAGSVNLTVHNVTLVDLVAKDMTLHVKHRKKFHDAVENVSTLKRLSSVNCAERQFMKLGVYSDNTLCMRTESNYFSCFNKNCKVFGGISREKSFRYALKLITICGANRRDFLNLMRIRDLKARNCAKQYKTAIQSYIYSLPEWVRFFAKDCVPRKKGTKVRRNGGRGKPLPFFAGSMPKKH